MMRRTAPLTFTWLLLIAIAPVSMAQPNLQFDPDLVVAKVGQYEITLGKMRNAVERRGMIRSNPEEDAQRRRDLLEGMIDDGLVSAEAAQSNLDGHHGAMARVRRGVTQAAAAIYHREVLEAMYNLDSATIDTFYHNHIGRYSSPRDQRRMRVISVWKEGKRPGEGMIDYFDSVYTGWYPEDKIDSIYIRLGEGEDFASLAASHSEDPTTRAKSGDLGWVSEQSFGSITFGERIMSQPLHLISKPMETDEAWHIVQIVAERPAGPVPLDNEIRADIVENLIKQQQEKMVKEIGDSLLAVAKIDWNHDLDALLHEELRNDMVFAVVNGRDTLYAEEYLQEVSKWLERQTLAEPDPVRRADILRNDYIRRLCWLGFLREKGYVDRPEVTARRDFSMQEERMAIVRQKIQPTSVPEPDSAAIRRYYENNKKLYGDHSTALTMAWNTIKAKIVADYKDQAHRRWRESRAARYGVTRYEDRLAQLPLLEPRPKRP